jgi:hypothetical protein
MIKPDKIKRGHWHSVGPNPRLGADKLFKIVLDKPKENSLLPAYISSVCAAIEGCINEGYINFYYRKFGNDYKKHVSSFFYLSLEIKLKHLIHLVTNFKYSLNQNNPNVKFLFKVITLRNNLLHVQHHLKPGTFIYNPLGGFDFIYDDYEGSCYYASGTWKDISSKDILEIHGFLDVILPLLFALANYKNKRALVIAGFIKKIETTKD